MPKSDRSDVRVLHGDLEYHILLVRLLSVSTEGKNGVAEATCQNLYTAENVLEHLKVRACASVGRVTVSERQCAACCASVVTGHHWLLGPEDRAVRAIEQRVSRHG